MPFISGGRYFYFTNDIIYSERGFLIFAHTLFYSNGPNGFF